MKIMIICKHIKKKIIHHIKCTHEMKQKYKVIHNNKAQIQTYTQTYIKDQSDEKKIIFPKREKNGNEKIIVDGCFCVNNFCFMR